MRIGIDCRLWSESGVGRYIRNLVKNIQLIDKENEYVLFVLSKDCEKFKVQSFDFARGKSSKFKVKVVNIRWHTVEEQIKFPSILNKENLDLMHFTYVSVPVFYNKPFVVTIHDLIPYHFPTGLATTLPLPLYKLKLLGYKYVVSKAAQKAKKIIAVSNTTKDEIVDHLRVDPSKVVVAYEGVVPQITNHKSQITNKSQNTKYKILDTKYFLYVGNAYPHKNLERLLEAFKLFCHPEASAEGSQILRSSQSDISLVLLGKGDYFYKRLKKKAKEMNLERSVIFYGEVIDSELNLFYKNALALVMPSFMEGFGLPALEAMANRCLVLASDISSLKEICGDAAIYFDPYDVKDMLKKMVNIYHSNDTYHYSEKIKAGFGRAKMFSWRKMVKETLGVYEAVLVDGTQVST